MYIHNKVLCLLAIFRSYLQDSVLDQINCFASVTEKYSTESAA